jgi:hypothetical protein
MLEVAFEWTRPLNGIDQEIKDAINAKWQKLAQELYDKVLENVSGRILKKQTGSLADKIYKDTEQDGDSFFMFVGVKDPGPKEWALEKGGSGFYPITPKNARVLMWERYGKKNFASYVNHPPLWAFGYLQEAFNEMEDVIPEQMASAISAVIWGR